MSHMGTQNLDPVPLGGARCRMAGWKDHEGFRLRSRGRPHLRRGRVFCRSLALWPARHLGRRPPRPVGGFGGRCVTRVVCASAGQKAMRAVAEPIRRAVCSFSRRRPLRWGIQPGRGPLVHPAAEHRTDRALLHAGEPRDIGPGVDAETDDSSAAPGLPNCWSGDDGERARNRRESHPSGEPAPCQYPPRRHRASVTQTGRTPV